MSGLPAFSFGIPKRPGLASPTTGALESDSDRGVCCRLSCGTRTRSELREAKISCSGSAHAKNTRVRIQQYDGAAVQYPVCQGGWKRVAEIGILSCGETIGQPAPAEYLPHESSPLSGCAASWRKHRPFRCDSITLEVVNGGF